MFERARCMLVKEFIQVFRDPRMKTVIFVMPVVQMLIFGYAATMDVRNVPTAIYDLDNSVASRELVSRFVESGYFDVVDRPSSDRQVRRLLDRGAALAVLRLNQGFQEDLRGGRTARLQVLLDGTDSNTAGIVLSYAARVAGKFSRDVLVERLRRQGFPEPLDPADLRTRAWFNENLESRNFFVPGVIALLVMFQTLMLTGMAVVREKEIGTLEQIIVSPIRPREFILGKTAPFVLIGFADVTLVTVVGVFWFGVPVRGSLLLLFGATGLFLMTSIGAGLLVSTISHTQQQAMMATFFFGFPAILLSGFIFPIANMPAAVQWLTYANPLRYFLVIIRGVFLKGVGAEVLWPQLAALAVMGAATLSLAIARFRKTLA